MEKFFAGAMSVLLIWIFGCLMYFGLTPSGKEAWNNWFRAVQEVDDNTNYQTLKKVEDTCRSMVSSYEADMLTYEQLKDSDVEEKREWAEQAKMRANKTASTYNNYILQNMYIWKNNVPDDIRAELPYID